MARAVKGECVSQRRIKLMWIARKNTGSVSRQATGVAMVLTETTLNLCVEW